MSERERERDACKERASEDRMIESTHKCADQTWIHWAALGLSDISVQAYLNQPFLRWLVSSQPHFVLAPLHDPTRSFKNYMKNANGGIMWKAKQINHVFCMPRYLASIVRFENVCRILSVLSLITRSWMWLGRIKARGKNLYSAGNILVAQAFADYIELKNSRCEKKLSTKSSLEKLTYRRMFERCRARDFLRQIWSIPRKWLTFCPRLKVINLSGPIDVSIKKKKEMHSIKQPYIYDFQAAYKVNNQKDMAPQYVKW